MRWPFLAVLFLTASAMAELPLVGKKPFFGAFVGQENRQSQYEIQRTGDLHAFMVKRDGSRFISGEVSFKFFLEEKGEDRWYSRRPKKDQITSNTKPTLEPEKVVIDVVFSNEAKVQVTYNFLKGALIEYDIELLDKGKAKGELRYGFDLKMKRQHITIKDNDDRILKKKTKDSQLTMINTKNKKKRVLMYEYVQAVKEELSDFLEPGLSSVNLEAKAFRGNEIDLSVSPTGGASLGFWGRDDRRFYDVGHFRVLAEQGKRKSGPMGVFRVAR